MIRAEIVEATREHAEYIAQHCRQEDAEELWAATLSTPRQVLKRALDCSPIAKTGLIDGVPVCMWGVAPIDLLFGLAAPWMVGTHDLDAKAHIFLRRCREPLLELFEGYDMLENYVDARNTRAIRWLKFMGFTVEKDPQPYGVLKMPFHRFYKEVNRV